MLAALLVAAAGASGARASAGDCGQTGCVILVEVDGLEPGDVSATGTPFLWALAHPSSRGLSDPQGTVYDGVLQDRNGFMWHAGRAPMTAGTATATASLLTGAGADQHGIVADEFMDAASPISPPEAHRLRPASDAGGGEAVAIKLGVDSLFELATNSTSAPNPEAWAFIGNPALALMLDEPLQLPGVGQKWSPTAGSGSDPALCPLPRRLPTLGEGTGEQVEGLPQRDCPARDGVTLQRAFSAMSEHPASKTPLLAYIHLAELGRTKQLHGDAEAAKTLEHLDAALAAFVEGLATHPETSGAWARTLLVVTGNHGYEPTPVDRRVPHPDPERVDDPRYDFSDFLVDALPGENRETILVPQGTIGTVYAPADATPEELTALATLVEDKADEGCQALAQEDCVAEVAPVASLAELHSTWRLVPLTAAPSAADLVVTLKPGWAFGRVAQRLNAAATDVEAEATNPYPGSAGGPRNRAIAVLMNGPDESGALPHTIRQGPVGGMPVAETAQTPPACVERSDIGPADANDPETMADDADAPGHECQPETVDIALSVAGMLKLDTEGVPIAPNARFLNEAFTPPLGVQEEPPEEQPELPQPEPPPPPEPIVIVRGSVQVITPPPPRDPFPYRGLIRRLRVRVTDAAGRAFALARRGATLSTIQVQADFGKPFSRVTLTFYKQRRGAGERARLSAIARFKPFVVNRGPVRLRLRIPSRFRPTHLGVSVQEVASEDPAAQPLGRPGGGIAQIADARRLHTRKGASRRARR
ncbi:MAG TPA: alkaline phosphatase family protein [Solirubrobacteraceae bacterium]|nr:alkaline phosphatase family protein [Solirubrobacteraceae bacterium]